jgi:anhydro-N-acetylmuramic acid kinase
MPIFHRAAFGAPGETRVVVNIGGIANVTVLDGDGSTRGWDVGPGNVLMDAWTARHRDAAYDRDGAWAAGSAVDETLLAALRGEPWFADAPPKSAGRELFNLDWVHARAPAVTTMEPIAVQSTLCELTARAIADSLRGRAFSRLIVCGGGARNAELLRRLQGLLPGTAVEMSAAHGVDPDYVEAIGFAWLARQTLAGEPGNIPSVTGARRPAVLGGIFHP